MIKSKNKIIHFRCFIKLAFKPWGTNWNLNSGYAINMTMQDSQLTHGKEGYPADLGGSKTKQKKFQFWKNRVDHRDLWQFEMLKGEMITRCWQYKVDTPSYLQLLYENY